MKIKKGDKVKIITGKDLGKEGVVQRVFLQSDRIIVSGVNIAKKHVKPGAVSKEGGIISVEKSIHSSNVMIVCEKCNKPVRIGRTVVKGKKLRICKKCQEVLDK